MKNIFVLFFTLVLSSFAFAAIGDGSASQALQASSSNENADMIIDVPQNTIDLSHVDDGMKKNTNAHIELSASTWSPSNFSDSSYLTNVSDFKSAGLPQLALSIAGSGWDFSQINLAPKVGFAYSKYTRTGDLAISNSYVQLSQDMNLYSLFFGLEAVSQRVWWNHMQAYLNAGVMPTWAQAASSNFSSGNSSSYWAAKESLGLIWNFKAHDSLATTEGWAAELGVETTQGLGSAPLSGTGILAGVRVAL